MGVYTVGLYTWEYIHCTAGSPALALWPVWGNGGHRAGGVEGVVAVVAVVEGGVVVLVYYSRRSIN